MTTSEISEITEILTVVEEANRGLDLSDPGLPDPVAPHSDGHVELPVGLLLPTGKLLDTAEVRELNGYDEEAYGKARSIGAGLSVLLERATVSLGGSPTNRKQLAQLTTGDRNELLLGIRTATWGDGAELTILCPECDEWSSPTVFLSGLRRRTLNDKIRDRSATIVLPSGRVAVCGWPHGDAHEKLLSGTLNNGGEIVTEMLLSAVDEIDDLPVSRDTIRGLSAADRKKLSDWILETQPGPDLGDCPVVCEHCGAESKHNISVGALFPF